MVSVGISSLGRTQLNFITRDSIYVPVRLSVCLSVRRVDHTKTVEVRSTKFPPYGSPIPLVFAG